MTESTERLRPAWIPWPAVDIGFARWVAPTASDPYRPLRYGLSLLGVVFLLATFIPSHGFDLFAYWTIHANPYAPVVDDINGFGAFRYAPPIAMLMAPLGAVPWAAVVVGWMVLQLAALWYIGRGWALALIAFPPVWLDIVYGNIYILIGAMIVAGFRYPSVWSFALLTKVTPGVGLIWFAVRREWRSLGLAIGATGLLALVSLALLGTGPWDGWVQVIATRNAEPIPPDALQIPLIPRLVLAAFVVALAGRSDRRWLVPIGVVLAMPVLWVIAFTPLVAEVALLRPAARHATLPRTATTRSPRMTIQQRPHAEIQPNRPRP